MIAAFDVQYHADGSALAAAVVFERFTDAEPLATYTFHISAVEEYVPGQFYRRELPCLLGLLDTISEPLHTLIVDSYVQLPDGPGLGQHLVNALDDSYTVIGVAKSYFAGSSAHELKRGTSNRSLFVTSTEDAAEAVDAIRSMHGPHRLPTLLKLVDQLARGHAPSN